MIANEPAILDEIQDAVRDECVGLGAAIRSRQIMAVVLVMAAREKVLVDRIAALDNQLNDLARVVHEARS